MNDYMRWLVALLSDTGMRLGEAVGLSVEDFHLNDEIPYIDITPHPWRRLKTKGSEKDMCTIYHWLEKPCGRLLGRLKGLLEAVFYSLDIIVLYLAMLTQHQLLSTSG